MNPNDHSRVIIHIDLDCFYAQVEMIKNPKLRDQAVGIQQKNIVVTSNYTARSFGIKKCMLITDAKRLCPSLVLVNGEDLHDYRQISYKVTSLLQKYTNFVERLGLDENFLDVTNMVNQRLMSRRDINVVGNVFGDITDCCDCGCEERLKMGSIIAQDIRNTIMNELKLTSCAGVAHNKLLAKIVGSKYKPNQQTVVFPNSTLELILSLKSLHSIPWIGRVTVDQLTDININTIEDLHNANKDVIYKQVGHEKAKLIKNLTYGIDNSPVKPSGRPQSIGLEDSCKSVTIEKEVKNKLQQLLHRLLILVEEDGRIPRTIKLTVRKFDKTRNIHHRETRQCNIQFSVTSNNENKIMTTIMHLFSKLVNVNKPYHITLLGLSFTKFHDPRKSSIVSYFQKNLEVQSIISIENNSFGEVQDYQLDLPTSTGIEWKSESPSPKKMKIDNLISKRLTFGKFDDCASPSKLGIADLCLSNEDIVCPPNADKKVFRELPKDVQKEIWNDYKRERERSCGNIAKKAKTNTLYNYFIKN